MKDLFKVTVKIDNVLRLCVRLRSVGLCVGQLAQNRCYKLAADYYTETLIEAVTKRI